MSSTMVMTMMTTSTSTSTTTLCSGPDPDPLGPVSSSSCPGCGLGLPPLDQAQSDLLGARERVAQLEREVQQLNRKASAAVDRWANYEVELSKLRSQLPPSNPNSNALPPASSSLLLPDASQQQSPTASSFLQSGTSRLSSLLYPRKSAQTLRPGDGRPAPLRTASVPATGGQAGSNDSVSPTSGSTAEGLLEALTREQSLRREAEGRLSATSKEVEELSASLFEQANEMVADERRARARLEERVGELEKRDTEKKRRLERLESAMVRIERVKKLIEEQ